MLKSSVYVIDPATGATVTVTLVETDAHGRLVVAAELARGRTVTLEEAMRGNGLTYRVERDWGLGYNRWRTLVGGFGWGRPGPRG